MDYGTPTIDVIESATQLIEAYLGPAYDGDGYLWSQGYVAAPVEAVLEEEQQ